jgi:branched-chain amino acid aminotransferase
MREIVFLNGKFLSADEAKVSIFDPGLLYGLGLFETVRSYNNKIVYFEEHLMRILDSAGLIGIKSPYSKQKLKEIIKETIKKNGFKDTYVRLTLWKTGISVIVRRYKPNSAQKYKKGFNACVSSFRQNEDSLLARIKTTSRILYQLSLQEAKNQGLDEAIILNNRGHITEGTRSNIFLVKGKEIFTPALECGCLNGITRRVIFDLAGKNGLDIYEGKFTLQDLYRADEAFLTNSLMGIMPIASIEGITIGENKCRKIANLFIKKYNCLLR